MVNNSRFKVNTLIQMARITENQELRERYIAQAEDILEEMDLNISNTSPVEMFLSEKCDLSGSNRIDRTVLYKKFQDYCTDKKLPLCSKNIFYATLRKNKVREGKSGYHYFVIQVSK